MSKSIKLTSAKNNVQFNIRVNEKLQHRSDSFSMEAVETYKERMLEGREFTPVQVIRLDNPKDSRYNGDYLCGGFHRVEAYRAALKEAKKNPSIRVKPLMFHLNSTVNSWDALVETSMIEGYMDNETNGVQLTKKDRNDLVIHLYNTGMKQSLIAKRTKIHRTTVAKILKPLTEAKKTEQLQEVNKLLLANPKISNRELERSTGIDRRSLKQLREVEHMSKTDICTTPAFPKENLKTPVQMSESDKCTTNKIPKMEHMSKTDICTTYTLEEALSLIECVINNENQEMCKLTPDQFKLVKKLIAKAQKTTEIRLGSQVKSLSDQVESLKVENESLRSRMASTENTVKKAANVVKSVVKPIPRVKPVEIPRKSPQLPQGITPRFYRDYKHLDAQGLREEAASLAQYGEIDDSSKLYQLADWKENTCNN